MENRPNYSEQNPFEVLWQTIPDFKPGSLTPQELVDTIGARIGRHIHGPERADLMWLAAEELKNDYEQYGEMDNEAIS